LEALALEACRAQKSSERCVQMSEGRLLFEHGELDRHNADLGAAGSASGDA
jgi:hypothetical protein